MGRNSQWDIYAPSYSGYAANDAGCMANLPKGAIKDIYPPSWQKPIISYQSGFIHSVSLVIQPGPSLENWDVAQGHSPEIHNHITNFVNESV